jgi:hypothetical protein
MVSIKANAVIGHPFQAGSSAAAPVGSGPLPQPLPGPAVLSARPASPAIAADRRGAAVSILLKEAFPVRPVRSRSTGNASSVSPDAAPDRGPRHTRGPCAGVEMLQLVLDPRPHPDQFVPMQQQLPLVPLLARWRPDARKPSFHQQLENMTRVALENQPPPLRFTTQTASANRDSWPGAARASPLACAGASAASADPVAQPTPRTLPDGHLLHDPSEAELQ